MDTPSRPKPAGSLLPPGVEREVITGYLEDHYSRWPDMPLGALGGGTAREAVKTAAGRAKVEMVLRDIENGEERKRRAGDPAYDVRKLRRELGLEE
jgi:hypothetical protein